MPVSPEQLKHAVGAGLLSFPVTHFDAGRRFAAEPYRRHIDWMVGHRPAALFAAGGTGEFFSLGLAEYPAIVAAAVDSAAARVPVLAGVGYGTELAVAFAQAAERAGADGLLVLPHYLVQVEQAGLYEHLKAVCRSVGIGVIVYHRDNCLIAADTLARLAEDCPNLVGFKDGHGDVEQLTRIRTLLGDRLTYVGGMPTAEVFASANHAIGITTYSSAVFNFIPDFAQRFYDAIRSGRHAVVEDGLKRFFLPYLDIRNRRRGYAVSIVKAGLDLVGRPAGPVRPPLTDLTLAERAELARLIAGMGAETAAAAQ